MLFHDETEICRDLVPLGFSWGVLEDDGAGMMDCIAAFSKADDARELVDYLQAGGRAVVCVNLQSRVD